MQPSVGQRPELARALTRRRRLRWTPLLLSLLALVLVAIIATGIGSVAIAPAQVLSAVWHGLTGNLQSSIDTIIWQIRLPRVLLAGLVGASLALAGVAFQGIFRNPLADPYLLGVASGAGFGATLVLAFSASVPFLARLGVPLAAFASALITVVLVMMLAKQGSRVSIVSLILAGVVVGSSLTAATSFVMLAAREQAAGILAWLLGSFGFASWDNIFSVLPLMLLAAVITMLSARALNLMQLGEEGAAQLGLPVEAFKYSLLAVATLATAAAVSVAGIIGFVGLMIPHAVRLAFGPDHRTLAPLAALWGALFMMLADLLARTLIAPAELPVGVITALVGGPFFLYLLRRSKGGRE